LTEGQILAWADDHHAHTGRWPTSTDRHVRANLNEKWRNNDASLRKGDRGLPGGDSLPRLLARERGARNYQDLPELTEEQILAWAERYRAGTGAWPRCDADERVAEAPNEKWRNIDQALRDGGRGLPGGSSLARLLPRERGARNLHGLPQLTEALIAAWAQAHGRRTGAWPLMSSGPVEGGDGESW
jgi:hypothetical protein